MVVRDAGAVQRLPGPQSRAESVPGMTGLITLHAKHAGERSAGKPLAAFDVAGAGNVTMAAGLRATAKACGNTHRRLRSARQSSTLPMSGMWKRSHGLAHRAPLTERGGNSDAQTYRHRATSRLYRFRESGRCSARGNFLAVSGR